MPLARNQWDADEFPRGERVGHHRIVRVAQPPKRPGVLKKRIRDQVQPLPVHPTVVSLDQGWPRQRQPKSLDPGAVRTIQEKRSGLFITAAWKDHKAS